MQKKMFLTSIFLIGFMLTVAAAVPYRSKICLNGVWEGCFTQNQQIPGNVAWFPVRIPSSWGGQGRTAWNLPPESKSAIYGNFRLKLDIPKEWLNRSINVGFSGGERKKLMLLRLIMTEPKFAILDEPDSGADSTVQKQIVQTIEAMRDTTFLFISHQPSFTSLIKPTAITSLSSGKLMIE